MRNVTIEDYSKINMGGCGGIISTSIGGGASDWNAQLPTIGYLDINKGFGTLGSTSTT